MAHSEDRIAVPPVGKIIQRTRRKLRMKQEELASKVGELGWDRPSHYTIYKIESGTRSVTTHELAMIAAALNVTMAYVLGESTRRHKSRQRIDGAS